MSLPCVFACVSPAAAGLGVAGLSSVQLCLQEIQEEHNKQADGAEGDADEPKILIVCQEVRQLWPLPHS